MEIPALEELKALDGTCFQKAKTAGELTFSLREQDMSSPQIICEWIKYNIRTCPPEKLHNALAIAIHMAKSPKRKHAD